MQPSADGAWQKWLLKQRERIRLLYAMQEEAIQQGGWEVLQQLQQEQEELLQDLWQVPPSHLPPEVLVFVREVLQVNLRLQQMVQERMNSLRAEMAELTHSRSALNRYHAGTSPGRFEDRAA